MNVLLMFRILADHFLTPLQEAVDEWKKSSSVLEKDHTKGTYIKNVFPKFICSLF